MILGLVLTKRKPAVKNMQSNVLKFRHAVKRTQILTCSQTYLNSDMQSNVLKFGMTLCSGQRFHNGHQLRTSIFFIPFIWLNLLMLSLVILSIPKCELFYKLYLSP